MYLKRCFKCCRDLPKDEFYRHSQMADGLLGKCKSCTKRDVKEHREANIDRVREYDRQRSKEPGRKLRSLEYQRTRRRRFPEKSRARGMVAKAIRSGRLVPQPCEVCGCEGAEAHHDDYSKPLDVRWLCFTHHRKEHGQLTV